MCRNPVLRMALIVLVPIAAAILALYLYQDRMIYFPRHYSDRDVGGLPPSVRQVHFSTAQGKQTAFYVPPAKGKRPRRLWVAFGGNGSVAIDWIHIATDKRQDPGDAFLLVDYPGYGLCDGCPGPAQIRENGKRAFEEAARLAGEEPGSLAQNAGVIGHSLGCAAALLFARDHPVDRVILLAPFTSLADMAGRRVGWPLKCLLRANYDNRAALDVLATRNPRPAVTILHGTEDEIIPFEMGRSLANAHPKMIRFIPVNGAGHNDVVDAAEPTVLNLMVKPANSPDARVRAAESGASTH